MYLAWPGLQDAAEDLSFAEKRLKDMEQQSDRLTQHLDSLQVRGEGQEQEASPVCVGGGQGLT